jgi:hypothetical protein
MHLGFPLPVCLEHVDIMEELLSTNVKVCGIIMMFLPSADLLQHVSASSRAAHCAATAAWVNTPARQLCEKLAGLMHLLGAVHSSAILRELNGLTSASVSQAHIFLLYTCIRRNESPSQSNIRELSALNVLMRQVSVRCTTAGQTFGVIRKTSFECRDSFEPVFASTYGAVWQHVLSDMHGAYKKEMVEVRRRPFPSNNVISNARRSHPRPRRNRAKKIVGSLPRLTPAALVAPQLRWLRTRGINIRNTFINFEMQSTLRHSASW